MREGVQFQDGTPFNADAVVENMKYFKEKPILFTKIDKVFDHVEKVDDHTVPFLPDGTIRPVPQRHHMDSVLHQRLPEKIRLER